MTHEELDKATADEAWRLLEEGQDVAVIAARLARERWRPPEPVDPDVLAFEQWFKGALSARPEYKEPYLAGARMARAQEQERAKALVEPAEAIVNRAVKGTGANDVRWPHILKAARLLNDALNAYKAPKRGE